MVRSGQVHAGKSGNVGVQRGHVGGIGFQRAIIDPVHAIIGGEDIFRQQASPFCVLGLGHVGVLVCAARDIPGLGRQGKRQGHEGCGEQGSGELHDEKSSDCCRDIIHPREQGP